jgi:hypothetical protein
LVRRKLDEMHGLDFGTVFKVSPSHRQLQFDLRVSWPKEISVSPRNEMRSAREFSFMFVTLWPGLSVGL